MDRDGKPPPPRASLSDDTRLRADFSLTGKEEQVKEYLGQRDLTGLKDGISLTETHLFDRMSTGWIGRYQIRRVLGVGGFGSVFLAYDDQLDRMVAIKVPRPERFTDPKIAETFLNEARMVASLDHPHIVPVHDVGQSDDGTFYVVSKFIEGTTLGERIKDLSHEESARILVPIAEALHHAHQHRLVHRDVKPSNILLDASSGKPYIADFGLAIHEETYVQEGRVAGTTPFMSPEQARAEGHRLDGRSDVFSLGIVFYLMLTGRRPFRGSTHNEMLHEIVSVNPQPPRDLDESIPPELERICLKALSKKLTERYASAAEFAKDLSQYKSDVDRGRKSSPPLVPRGLRSFNASDAEFFLDLLPGPSNREGLPESVQFWVTRLEENDPEWTFSVGIMYGPSGCGKSSMVKAGLIPRLPSKVLAIYIEATQTETEARILHALRRHFPELPADCDVIQACRFLRNESKRKVVFLIDQFEQWLHANATDTDAELVGALRQCDGGSLQAVIMVRDDFAMALAQFMDAIEVPILQGNNFATIDLFTLEHARNILTRFGQAYDRLPAKPEDFTAEQCRFIESAVAGLAHELRVVPVQLALFSEMVKSKPWVPDTLRNLGGTEGVGVGFLEESFGGRTANPKHQQHQSAARKILKALMPETGSEIRGHTRSHDELLALSGYQNHPGKFNELMRILDGELRLLTPANPRGVRSDSGSDIASKHYQLTHDYLVSSLRVWLTRAQQETRQGRAELLLTQRTSLWRAQPEKRQLPSWSEWVVIFRFTRRQSWTPDQRKMMRRATIRHSVSACQLLGVAMLTAWLINETRTYGNAFAVVKKLEVAELHDIPQIADDFERHRRWANVLLERALNQDELQPRQKLNASLIRPQKDDATLLYLTDELLQAEPETLTVIRDHLAPHVDRLPVELWEMVENPDVPTARRLRAASGLAAFDTDSSRWPASSAEITSWLISQDPSSVEYWTRIFSAVGSHFVQPLQNAMLLGNEAETAGMYLARFLKNDPETIARLVFISAPRHLRILTSEVDRAELSKHLERNIKSLGNLPTDAQASSNAAVVLTMLNGSDQAWRNLTDDAPTTLRTATIRSLSSSGIDVFQLLRRLRSESDPSSRQAIILALGDRLDDITLKTKRDEVAPLLLRFYEDDAEPGVHSAAEWVLKKWGVDSEITKVRRTPAALVSEKPRGWFVNSQGQTMIVVDGPITFSMGTPRTEANRDGQEQLHRRRIPRTFAVSATEVTVDQFQQFQPKFRYDRKLCPTSNCPINSVSWDDAAQYCNWLSNAEGLQECYRIETDKNKALRATPYPNSLERDGYRLPTEAEWECVCRAGTGTSRFFGEDLAMTQDYVWFQENASGTTRPVGSLRPNRWGFFDMLGNVGEWCHDFYAEYPVKDDQALGDDFITDNEGGLRVLRGSSFNTRKTGLRSGKRLQIYSSRMFMAGFRIARSIN